MQVFYDIKTKCHDISASTADILDFEFSVEHLYLRFTDKQPKSKFIFTISKPTLGQNSNASPVFELTYFPKNTREMDEVTITSESDKVTSKLQAWVQVLKNYNNLQASLNLEDRFEKLYEAEFFHDLKSTDANADSAPLELTKQRILVELLEYIEDRIGQSEQDDTTIEILSESNDLKNNVQRLTKNQSLHKLARIKAKIFMKGSGFVKFVFSLAKDEIPKFLLKKGLESGYEHITAFIGHLG